MNRFSLAVSRGIGRVTESALGPYQTAVIRIGFAATWLLFLLREFPYRQELYGPDGPWSWALAEELIGLNGSFTALMWTDGQLWFESVYLLAALSALLLLLGWRTRTMSVLFMVGVFSLQNRSVFVGDGGDNVLHLMSFYLVFTRCGQVWSLDARRERRAAAARARGEWVTDRAGPVLWGVMAFALTAVTLSGRMNSGDGADGEWSVPVLLWGVLLTQALWWGLARVARTRPRPRVLLDVIANIVHNGALLVIMAEACLIYATAGWYKIQGSRWQDGTAVYYPLHLDYFSPWPALGDLLTASGTIVMLVTYGTVFAQIAFPFTLLHRRAKNVLLTAMIIEHAAIAVVLGLPFFSLAMIAADLVFLPTSFLRRVGGFVGGVGVGVRTRLRLRLRVGCAGRAGASGASGASGAPGAEGASGAEGAREEPDGRSGAGEAPPGSGGEGVTGSGGEGVTGRPEGTVGASA
ncbi:HTTM domain-containing protein [Streptomyces sp. NPDC091377]|uniref:HTTM domain-containing protein n=1 Tax=Streptomyces sp. NPDC091377 TaxID=3365995 RepID=UPI003825A0C0